LERVYLFHGQNNRDLRNQLDIGFPYQVTKKHNLDPNIKGTLETGTKSPPVSSLLIEEQVLPSQQNLSKLFFTIKADPSAHLLNGVCPAQELSWQGRLRLKRERASSRLTPSRKK